MKDKNIQMGWKRKIKGEDYLERKMKLCFQLLDYIVQVCFLQQYNFWGILF